MNSCSDLYANGDKLKWLAIAWNGTVFAAQMAAVNNHLAQIGEQPVSAEDIAKIKSHHQI